MIDDTDNLENLNANPHNSSMIFVKFFNYCNFNESCKDLQSVSGRGVATSISVQYSITPLTRDKPKEGYFEC